jgi:hypothetical protein
MVNVGVIAFDGTKMKANAAMRRNRIITQTEIEIKQMFEDSRRIDEEEDKNYGDKGNGDIVPETLKTHKRRQELFEAAKKKMNEESARENQDSNERMRQREEEENENSDGKNSLVESQNPLYRIHSRRCLIILVLAYDSSVFPPFDRQNALYAYDMVIIIVMKFCTFTFSGWPSNNCHGSLDGLELLSLSIHFM